MFMDCTAPHVLSEEEEEEWLPGWHSNPQAPSSGGHGWCSEMIGLDFVYFFKEMFIFCH